MVCSKFWKRKFKYSGFNFGHLLIFNFGRYYSLLLPEFLQFLILKHSSLRKIFNLILLTHSPLIKLAEIGLIVWLAFGIGRIIILKVVQCFFGVHGWWEVEEWLKERIWSFWGWWGVLVYCWCANFSLTWFDHLNHEFAILAMVYNLCAFWQSSTIYRSLDICPKCHIWMYYLKYSNIIDIKIIIIYFIKPQIYFFK